MALEKNFTSDIDKFLNEMLEKKPQIKSNQKVLRSTWWDKDFVDNEEQQTYKDSSAPKHGYAYFDYSNEAQKK